MTPNESDLLAKLVGLLSVLVAAVFFPATQTVRGSWIAILGGGVAVLGIEAYPTDGRIYR